MRSSAPPLLPILRSHTQGRILAAVLLHPDREVMTSDLARELRVPMSTASAEVGRLVDAGILSSRRLGRSVLLRANPKSRLVPPLTQLLAMTYGPRDAIAEEFAGIGDAVVIFGSWAAREHGSPGKEPGDVDVLVLGSVSRPEVYDAAARVEERVGFPVNPVVRPLTAWDDAGDPLVDEIRTKPYVVVHGHLATTQAKEYA